MIVLAHPWLAIALGFCMLCAETSLHFADIVAPASWVDLPVHDWIAGGLLVYGGLSTKRDWTRGRAIQAAGWGFMSSLLVAAFIGHWEEWRAGGAANGDWLTPDAFLFVIGAFMATSLGALLATLMKPPMSAI